MLVGVSAPYESRGKIVHPFLSFKAGDYFVRAMNVVATVGLDEHIFEYLRRTQIVALDPRVRAERRFAHQYLLPGLCPGSSSRHE